MRAAERLYRESLGDIGDPAVGLALRDGGVRRDFERLVVAALGPGAAEHDDVAESVLAGAVEASGGNAHHVDALATHRKNRRRPVPASLGRSLEFAVRPSRWGDAYAAAILPAGTPALFRILVQVELAANNSHRPSKTHEVEIDETFGLGVASSRSLQDHVADATTAAFDFLRTSAPGRPISDLDRVAVVRVFRGGLPWPFVRDLRLPWSFELKQETETHTGGSVGLAVGLALLNAFLAGWTTWEGPIWAATGEVTADGSVEAVGGVADKARAAAAVELPFLFPRRGTRGTVESRYRQVAVDSLGGAAAEVFNLAGPDVDAFLAKSPPVLYGREAELASLDAVWQRARAGHRRLALLHGESGIGKSGLVATQLRRLIGRGVPVVFGRANEDDSQVFGPIVNRLVGGLPADELRAHADKHGAWLSSLVPALSRYLPDHYGGALQEDRLHQKTSVSICALIRHCAARLGGLVLVIDDLQWGREETWPVLRQLLQPDEPTPVLVIATYRSTADNASDEAEPNLATLRVAGRIEEIAISGLTSDVVRAWVGSIIGEEAGDLSEAIAAVTAGNPLDIRNHLETLATRAREEGLPDPADLAATVYAVGPEVIPERLKSFDRLRTLKLAATVRTPEFSATLLQEAGIVSAADILQHLVDAQKANFITVVRPGRYTFAHQRVRDAVRALVLPEERAGYELALGRALERTATQLGGRIPFAELARHFAAAAPFERDVWQAASKYARAAAEEATRSSAYAATREFREMALRTYDMGGVDIPEYRCRLLLDLARATSYVGKEDEARTYFLEAKELAVAQELHDLVVEATLGFAGPPEDKGTTDLELLSLLEEADGLPIEPGDDRRARLRGRSTFELVLAARREPEEYPMPPVVDILATARARGDPIELSWALLARLMGYSPFDDRIAPRLELAEEMLVLAERHGERDLEAWAHAFRVIHLLELGRRGDAERVVDELAEVGRQLHYGYARWGEAVLRPVFAHLDGRFKQSRDMAESALRLRADALNSILYLYIQRMFALREEGEIGALERQLGMLSGRMGATTFQGAPAMVVQTAWALLRCETGDVAGARRSLDALIDSGFPGPLDDPAWITGVAFVAETCAYLGDTRLVPDLYELLKLRAGECIVVALAVACLGSVDRFIGMLAGMQGLWDEATDHFEAALVMNRDNLRSPVWTAHTQADYAATLARRGRPQDVSAARALCASAATTAQRLGMPRVQAQARAVLTSLG